MERAAKFAFVALALVLLAYLAFCLGFYTYGLRAWPEQSLEPPAPLAPALLAQFAALDRVQGPMPRLDPVTLPLRWQAMSEDDARWFGELDLASPRRSLPQQTATRSHLARVAAAIRISRSWSRDQVISARVRNAYFGRDAVGIDAAAQAWYGQPASQLQPRDVLALWVLAFSPRSFDPFCKPERFDERYRRHAALIPELAGSSPDAARERMRPMACD